MKTFAVILSGGSGTRFGEETPKQLSKLGGKTIIEHTIKVFQSSVLIKGIVIVTRKEEKILLSEICKNFSKVIKIVCGGMTRSDSSKAGLIALEGVAEPDDNVLIHDAVRPFVSESILQRCVAALIHSKAIDVVIPSNDTVVEIVSKNNKNQLLSIPNRSSLRRGQTPQGFKYSLIKKAYEKIKQYEYSFFTDDCSVFMKIYPNEPIICVDGEESNIKITQPQDIHIADKLLQIRLENPFEKLKNKLSNKVIVVFGGSYGIGEEIVKLAKNLGARVCPFSRSKTNTDVQNINDVKIALEQSNLKEKKIDFVVNTAAKLCMQNLEYMDYESIISQINTNYLGSVNVALASLPYLKKSSGQLLLFTSSSYTMGRCKYSLYSSSKAAIVNLTQALSEEWQPYGVRINCMCPERTKTPMRTRNFGIEPEETLLNPKEVAKKSLQTLVSKHNGSVIGVKK